MPRAAGRWDDRRASAVLRIHKNLRYLSDDSRFGPWVYSVARNAVIDRLRKRQPNLSDPSELDAVAAPDETGSAQALPDCVTPFVARRPAPYRHASTLVELQGLFQGEGAAHTTTRMWSHRVVQPA